MDAPYQTLRASLSAECVRDRETLEGRNRNVTQAI